MNEIFYNTSAWIFILIAATWIVRQILGATKLFGFKFDRRFIFIQAALIVIGIAVWVCGTWIAKSLPIDRCLDGGGRWNYDIKVCDAK